MDIRYEIKDGSLVFKDLRVGNLLTGEPLDWDTLRKVVILATRFATKRPIKRRTIKELTEDVTAFIEDKAQREKEGNREVNNLKVQLAASQDYIERQNIKYNELRIAYHEAARTIQELQKGA